jgi:pimeloyl-ACP methyl ester carboxylesterase
MRREIIEYEGLKLAALVAGDRASPALVLLHGWPHSKEVWDRIIAPLAEHHYVLAFDLPDIGESIGAPSSAEKRDLAELMLGAAERAGARSIVIAGFDVGGMIAYAAARDFADRIAGAVVMNTVIPGIDPWDKILSHPRIWHFAFHSIPELPEILVAGHQGAYFDWFADAFVGNKRALDVMHRATFAHAYERRESLKAGFDWYRAMHADAKRNRWRKDIEVPLLYLRGDADGRSPDDYLPGLRAAGAAHVTGGVLPDSGEIAPLEAPGAVVEALLAFALSCGSEDGPPRLVSGRGDALPIRAT